MGASRRTTDLNADEVIRYLAMARRLRDIAAIAPEMSAPLHLRLARARRLRTWGIWTIEEFRTDLLQLSREVHDLQDQLRVHDDQGEAQKPTAASNRAVTIANVDETRR